MFGAPDTAKLTLAILNEKRGDGAPKVGVSLQKPTINKSNDEADLNACRENLKKDPLSLDLLQNIIRKPKGKDMLQRALCGHYIPKSLLQELWTISRDQATEEMLWIRALIYSQYVFLLFLQKCYFYFQQHQHSVLISWLQDVYLNQVDVGGAALNLKKKEDIAARLKGLSRSLHRQEILSWIRYRGLADLKAKAEGASPTKLSENAKAENQNVNDFDLLLYKLVGFFLIDEESSDFYAVLEDVLSNVQEEACSKQRKFLDECLAANILGCVDKAMRSQHHLQTKSPSPTQEALIEDYYVPKQQDFDKSFDFLLSNLQSIPKSMFDDSDKGKCAYAKYLKRLNVYSCMAWGDVHEIYRRHLAALANSDQPNTQPSSFNGQNGIGFFPSSTKTKPLPHGFENVKKFVLEKKNLFECIEEWKEAAGFKVIVKSERANRWGLKKASIDYSEKRREYQAPSLKAVKQTVQIARANGEKALDITYISGSLKAEVIKIIYDYGCGLKVIDRSCPGLVVG